MRSFDRSASSFALILTLLLAACAGPDGGAADAVSSVFADSDWPAYGRDQAGTKFSPLTTIDRSNVASLEVAWTWETGETVIEGPAAPVRGSTVRPGTFEVTPIVVSDTMYVVTSYNRVLALDASTGEEIWEYDPLTTDFGQPPNGTGFVHRGIAMWTGESETGAPQRRIFLNSRWRLIAIDAATGMEIESFGYRGEIDLTADMIWHTNPLHYTQTSPPVVFGNVVILGNGVGDAIVYPYDPPGQLQAFDVLTGERVWNLNLIPQEGEPGNETWEGDSETFTGHTNAWAPMALDDERGIVYLGVGTPSNDYYGGHRLGDNLYAESLLAVDARTGELLWHFQTVHHGLWDYDLPAPPVLYTEEVDGRSIEAVAIVGKTGFVYVFDRVTGEPVWPIEERAVPGSEVPGEVAAPTQPFPTLPEPFSRQQFTPDDLIDLTPELRRRAVEMTRGVQFGGLFTPPTMQGTLAMPGIIGGGNWGGSAVDPTTGLMFVKATEEASLLKIAAPDPARTVGDYGIDRASNRSLRIEGIPITNPPWGTLSAIDMSTGRLAWQVPVGDRPELRDHPLLRGVELPDRLGVQGAAGPVVTAGGLIFLTGGGDVLYAFDSSSGEEVWSAQLPAVGYANPMTYGDASGRQFVVIATGARGENGILVAFALPE
ncbi:MAG: pyrroloquinoline quinone-dependent dehydrogenase [Gemmatimonadales bacterium]|jgi:quinoprotein glucose dehydrogenase|nr:pyrroloquinoline quinone-dependent dehydrogenase [Gemmatimonadales bacterium]MBT3958975.1 pyrroloquinoline quinone-dependent dehydrogenase [Gemmatimonadales bacterium]MBT4438425.1 pyrroloquinoline quinone-dependent dehydrogenase [Gemmatimonadales bacterium]MBT4913673.1 pyrroloquinoline quinone-dependent dehydrogenase [Gemmatimonadales bacterium]MBT5697728.1 pyrroloquinoline quinone-dependent dehydrogenase [Gemmatimonadales bacterium]